MNNGLSFEGLLAKLGIPNQPYLDKDRFEELCIRINLVLSPIE